jgi:hypothetical protein
MSVSFCCSNVVGSLSFSIGHHLSGTINNLLYHIGRAASIGVGNPAALTKKDSDGTDNLPYAFLERTALCTNTLTAITAAQSDMDADMRGLAARSSAKLAEMADGEFEETAFDLADECEPDDAA